MGSPVSNGSETADFLTNLVPAERKRFSAIFRRFCTELSEFLLDVRNDLQKWEKRIAALVKIIFRPEANCAPN
jgi:hypothetical protein